MKKEVVNIEPNALLENGQKLLNAYINIECNLPTVFGFDSETLEPISSPFLKVTWLDDNFEDAVKSSTQSALTPADKENIVASQSIGRKYSNAYNLKNSHDIFNAFIVGDKVYGYTDKDEPVISELGDIKRVDGETLTSLYSETELDWEFRRYEIAKANLAGLMNVEALRCYNNPPTRELYAKAAIAYADALIVELKKQV